MPQENLEIVRRAVERSWPESSEGTFAPPSTWQRWRRMLNLSRLPGSWRGEASSAPTGSPRS